MPSPTAAPSLCYNEMYMNMFNIFKNPNGLGDTKPATPQAPEKNSTHLSEPAPIVAIPTRTIDSASGDINDNIAEQVMDAVANDLHCTLTIGEAQDLFRRNLRRPLSERSLQRYCNTGAIAAEMISHSQGKEWLLNEASLLRFIERYPITLTPGDATDAGDGAAPAHRASRSGDATSTTTPARKSKDLEFQSVDTDAKASAKSSNTPAHGDAGPTDDAPKGAPVTAQTVATDAAPAADIDDTTDDTTATDDFADPSTSGERRHLGDILIENARLTAIIEGKTELISTLKLHEERTHEDLVQSRTLVSKLTNDVRDINAKMLDTMLTMAQGKKSLPGSPATEVESQPENRLSHRRGI